MKKDVYLYHFPLSNCSQRARLALEEKGVPWVSHVVDLTRFENLQPEYLHINPKGLVPALRHGHTIITESIRIIQYVDAYFLGPSLVPRSGSTAWQCILRLSDELQRSIKTLTFELLFRKTPYLQGDQLAYYEKHQLNNPAAVQFARDFASGFSRARLDRAMREVRAYCRELTAALGCASFLAGEEYSLADISAVVNVHRFRLLELDIPQSAALDNWYTRIEQRPAFQRAVRAFESPSFT